MNRSRMLQKNRLSQEKALSIQNAPTSSTAAKVWRIMILFGFMLNIVILTAGCGGGIDRCEIEGTVTVDGEPVKDGSITFQPAAGTSGHVSGASIVDGHYKIDKEKGPIAGEYLIVLTGRVPTGKKVVTEAAGEKIETEVMKDIIPLKHKIQSETMSNNKKIGTEPLKATVVSGKNVVDFKLTNR